jgi:hypothetical protein
VQSARPTGFLSSLLYASTLFANSVETAPTRPPLWDDTAPVTVTTEALTTVKYRASSTRLLQSQSALRGLSPSGAPQYSFLADDSLCWHQWSIARSRRKVAIRPSSRSYASYGATLHLVIAQPRLHANGNAGLFNILLNMRLFVQRA